MDRLHRRPWGAPEVSDEGAALEVLTVLVEACEMEHFPIDLPDPIEAIQFRMDQAGCSCKDLENLLGKSLVWELLNRKCGLYLNMIRKLHDEWKIPAEVLISDPD